jgi:hypothetical protein
MRKFVLASVDPSKFSSMKEMYEILEKGGSHKVVELLKEGREFSEWVDVIGDRKCVEMITCEFGFAEEVLAFMCFRGEGKSFETYEVGRGEAGRPYIEIYKGDNREDASEAFYWEIKHSLGDYPGIIEEEE